MTLSPGEVRSLRRFRHLMLSLVLLIVAVPFARGALARMSLAALFSIILLSAVRGLPADRRTFWTGMALAIPALAGSWAGLFLDSLPLQFATRALTVALLGLVVWTLLADIGRQTQIQPETIHQAACVYLILGIVFALLYASISAVDPAAFAPAVPPEGADSAPGVGAGPPPLARWIYFSFVTLTTVGFGDITAVAPAARSLVIVEALLGQFFVAVLVARLVGLLQAQLSAK